MKLSMKSTYLYISFLLLAFLPAACVDDTFIEKDPSNLPKDTNYKEFADGYSIAFNISLDHMGGNIATRANEDDTWLQESEDFLDPEEFRVLFFGEDNKFLFESKSRWLTEIDGSGGHRRWRIGIPIFQYLSDSYQQEGENSGQVSKDGQYNWEAIVEYLKTHSFKVCILANSPEFMKNLPILSDYAPNTEGLDRKGWNAEVFGLVGPFWTPKNSALTTDKNLVDWETRVNDDEMDYDPAKHNRDDYKETRVMTVFDLHHCQYDPFYDAKEQSYADDKGGAYAHIISKVYDSRISDDKEGVPYMGAYSSWLGDEKRYMTRDGKYIFSSEKFNKGLDDDGNYYVTDDNDNFILDDKDKKIRLYEYSFYRLPEDRLGKESVHRVNIPMYGIQKFDPLTDWTKGTTYNISEQTASQAKDYSYRSIFLLRSVVKLELRIPMYDDNDNLIKLDLNYTTLFHSNYLARREPMDVISPTDSIWETNHTINCEWTRINAYGPLCNITGSTKSEMDLFRQRLSWFHGVWNDQKWDFNGLYKSYPGSQPPHVYNPIVQRLQATFLNNCFLPIGIPREAFVNDNYVMSNPENEEFIYSEKIPEKREDAEEKYPSGQGYYYRWVIYCGERYINDANKLSYLSSNNDSHAFVAAFRVPVNDYKGKKKIYLLPIVNYSKAGGEGSALRTLLNQGDGDNNKSTDIPSAIQVYADAVAGLSGDNLPLPLIRNHLYRLNVSFGDGEDLNVQIIDSDQRDVFGIIFGRQ